MNPVAPVPATDMRSLPGERGVDAEGVVHRGHAHLVPDQAEVGPIDAGLGVEPDLAVAAWTETAASKDRGRVRSRAVSAPVTAIP